MDKQSTTDPLQQPPLERPVEEKIKQMAVNPNPRANENVDDEAGTTKGGVGSEITDGEGG